jgi:hypothetical protein
LFSNAIAPVTQRLQKQVGRKPTCASLFLPSIFHDEIISAAASAILPTYEDDINKMHGPHSRAALYGFHFLEGDYIGRTSEEREDHYAESLVLLLEYEKDYMYIWLMVVDPELGVNYP